VLNSRLLFLWLLCLNYFITLLQHVRGQSALCCQINVCMYVCKDWSVIREFVFVQGRFLEKVNVKERIVLRQIHLKTTGRHLSMESHSVICHPTKVTVPPSPQPGRLVSIYRPRKDEMLSWPSWLVTYRNGLPVHRRSPIRVLTRSDVAQLRWLKPTRYH